MNPSFPTALLVIVITAGSASAQSSQGAQDAQAPAPHQHAADQNAATLFATREASGTSWLPDASPMYGVHRTRGAWELMLHGSAFVQFLYEPGDRHRTGGSATRQVSSVNWGMLMARRPIGSGRLGLRVMASIE